MANDRYVASWHQTDGVTRFTLVQLFQHDWQDRLTTRVRERVRFAVGDRPDLVAFGGNAWPLEQRRLAKPDRHWTLEEGAFANGDVKYTLRQSIPHAGGDIPIAEWEINGSKGFVTTTFKAYAARGVIGMETTVTPVRVTDDGVWFPGEVVERTYHAWLMGPGEDVNAGRAREVSSSRRVRFRDIEFGRVWPADQFELRALRAPEGTMVARTRPDGTLDPIPFEIRDGVARPQRGRPDEAIP